MELAASLPKDMRDDIGEYVDSLDFNAMKISESCICMTYDDWRDILKFTFHHFSTLANNFSNIHWVHVYLKKTGVISCAWGKDCTTRVQLKVAKKTSVGSYMHEKIAGTILKPGKLHCKYEIQI